MSAVAAADRSLPSSVLLLKWRTTSFILLIIAILPLIMISIGHVCFNHISSSNSRRHDWHRLASGAQEPRIG